MEFCLFVFLGKGSRLRVEKKRLLQKKNYSFISPSSSSTVAPLTSLMPIDASSLPEENTREREARERESGRRVEEGGIDFALTLSFFFACEHRRSTSKHFFPFFVHSKKKEKNSPR